MSPMLYAQLALIGKFSMEELQQFRQWGSPTPGHPEVCYERGIENSSGPLGQGHAYAVGAAIAAKFLSARQIVKIDWFSAPARTVRGATIPSLRNSHAGKLYPMGRHIHRSAGLPFVQSADKVMTTAS